MDKKASYHVVAVNHLDLGFVKRKEEQAELLEIWVERMISVLERFPELKFAIEQAYHYKGLEQRRPDLFQKVKDLIAQGRVEMMGAMVSTMDTNFTNGESFVRNQSLGLRWTKEHLGTSPKAAWLIDTFGINAQIPQLLTQYGYCYLFANRFGGKIPYDLFRSQGIDGSEIVVLGKDLACQQVFPNSQAFVFCRGWNDTERLFQDADRLQGDLPRLVVLYLENEEVLSTYYRDLTLQRQNRAEEEWKFSSYGEYLEALSEQASLEQISGDLNPEFTGTFALRTPIKIWNRKAETALLETELWDGLLGLGLGDQLEKLWWELGYAQFHDVFSGSHEDCTYLDVIRTLQNTVEDARGLLKSQLPVKKDGSSLLCLNSLPFARKEWVEIPSANGRPLQVFQVNKEIPVEYQGNQAYCLAEVPPVSTTNLSVRWGEQLVNGEETWGEPCESCTLRNKWMTLSLHRVKGIESLTAQEILMEHVKDFLTVQHDKGSLQIEEALGEELSVMDGNSQLYYQENRMGQRAVFCGEFQNMKWNRGENHLGWRVEFFLPKERATLEVKIWLDWKGEATRIRWKVPHQVNSSQAFYEIPFGVVSRSTYDGHTTAKGEWPAHRFVAVEDGKKGLAMANKGVAGVELAGNAFETTLLRAFPDQPGTWVPVTPLTSQHGQHTYEFLLVPYLPGELPEVSNIAQAWNQPIYVLDGVCAPEWVQGSWLEIDKPNLVLSSVKSADDGSGDMIVRYYETSGRETEAKLILRDAEKVWLSDVTESFGSLVSCQNDVVSVHCRPFEIQTLRVKKHCGQ